MAKEEIKSIDVSKYTITESGNVIKDKLKQEAEEFVCSKQSFWKQGKTCVESVRQAYIASAKPRQKRIAELEKENAELKILISSMLYEINSLWDISEMNEDVRKHAERIDSEVEKC